MYWRFAACVILAVAAISIVLDAVLNAVGYVGLTPTTLLSFTSLLGLSPVEGLSGVVSDHESPLWQRATSIAFNVPVSFWLALLGGAALVRSQALQRRAHTTSSSTQYDASFNTFSVALLAVVSSLIVIVDASVGSVGVATARSTTFGEVWQQTHPVSLHAFHTQLLAPAGDGQGRAWLDWILHLPFWLFPAAAGLLVSACVPTYTPMPQIADAPIDSPSGDVERAGPIDTAMATKEARCLGPIISVGLFSVLINVLMLTGAIFMLEVYDRVLPSRSVPTLVALATIALVLFGAQIILDIVRNRMLVRIGNVFQQAVGGRTFDAQVRLVPKASQTAAHIEPMRDLDTIRSFLSGQGPVVLFDLPWLPIYLAVVFALHMWLGVTAVIGAILLVVMTALTDVLTRRPSNDASLAANTRHGVSEQARRNADVLMSMGMLERLRQRWEKADSDFLHRQSTISDIAGGFGSVAKGGRMVLQSAVLAVGAYLVILQEASAGVIIASAILTNRALAPLDQAIGQWRNFVAARQAWGRLSPVLAHSPQGVPPMVLPAPEHSVSVANVFAAAPGGRELVLRDISFDLSRGQGLGLIGPSGSGKSTLAKLLVGAWNPHQGRVLLDGAAVTQYALSERGRHIGYVPQVVELFDGTVAENISRFAAEADPNAIIAAAQSAGVHDLILSLPEGYDTRVGQQSEPLSVGQRQRIALARALYGDPFLVVLDEPNANLDADGDAALARAIRSVRERGGIVIVVAHRRSALSELDTVVTLHQGRMVAFGDTDSLVVRLQKQAADSKHQTTTPGSAGPMAAERA
ncbi:MAG: type I secretion system permease/ATPase [Hyphomicrobiaceae bacterium]